VEEQILAGWGVGAADRAGDGEYACGEFRFDESGEDAEGGMIDETEWSHWFR